MSDQELVAVLGKPELVRPSRNFVHYWWGDNLVLIGNSSRSVELCELGGGSFKTKDGVGIGSTLDQLVLTLGPPTSTMHVMRADGSGANMITAVRYGDAENVIIFMFHHPGSSAADYPTHEVVRIMAGYKSALYEIFPALFN